LHPLTVDTQPRGDQFTYWQESVLASKLFFDQ